MKSAKELTGENSHSAFEYSISRFHQVRHIVALVLTAGLCFSMIMSEVSYHMHPGAHHSSHLKQMIVPYLLMLFFVSTIALATILTACKIKIKSDGLEISNLFWKEKLGWKDLKSFTSPVNLKFAWLKTRYSFYILGKNEFKDWSKLEQQLSDRKIKS